MYISTGDYSLEAAQLLKKSTETSTKSLMDYMSDSNKDSSGYYSDKLQLSPEAYGALKTSNPDLLKSLGYEEESSLIKKVSDSTLDKVQLSEEAVAALRESNPEILRALGYDIPEE